MVIDSIMRYYENVSIFKDVIYFSHFILMMYILF